MNKATAAHEMNPEMPVTEEDNAQQAVPEPAAPPTAAPPTAAPPTAAPPTAPSPKVAPLHAAQAPVASEAPVNYGPPPAAHAPSRRLEDTYQRSPALAGVLSAVVPGFGNVYNGLFQRGLLIFVVLISLFFVAAQTDGGPELALLIPSMVFTWLFGIADSVRQATLINLGIRESDLVHNAERQAGGGLAVGVALFLVGLWGLLSQVFAIDLTSLFDYWYLLLMAFGGWLVFQGLRQRRNSSPSSGEL